METAMLGYVGSWGVSSAFCCLHCFCHFFRFAMVKDDNGGPFLASIWRPQRERAGDSSVQYVYIIIYIYYTVRP